MTHQINHVVLIGKVIQTWTYDGNRIVRLQMKRGSFLPKRTEGNSDLVNVVLPDAVSKGQVVEIGSELHAAAENIPFRELCRQMQIARGPDEYLKPVNVGLLLFNEQPDRFFRGARIEVIEYQDEVGDRYGKDIYRSASCSAPERPAVSEK